MTFQLHIISCFTALLFAVESKATVSNNKIPNLNSLYLSDVIRLSPHDIYKLTGHKMSLREKIAFSLSKHSMKKVLHKHGNLSFREFMSLKKDPGVLGGIFMVIGAIVLFVFLLFLVFYKD